MLKHSIFFQYSKPALQASIAFSLACLCYSHISLDFFWELNIN